MSQIEKDIETITASLSKVSDQIKTQAEAFVKNAKQSEEGRGNASRCRGRSCRREGEGGRRGEDESQGQGSLTCRSSLSTW